MENLHRSMDGVSRPKTGSSEVKTRTLGRLNDVLDGSVKVRIENLSVRGPVEIPVRHVTESGCFYTFWGMEYTPAIVYCLLEYGLATKAEYRFLRKLAGICG